MSLTLSKGITSLCLFFMTLQTAFNPKHQPLTAHKASTYCKHSSKFKGFRNKNGTDLASVICHAHLWDGHSCDYCVLCIKWAIKKRGGGSQSVYSVNDEAQTHVTKTTAGGRMVSVCTCLHMCEEKFHLSAILAASVKAEAPSPRRLLCLWIK